MTQEEKAKAYDKALELAKSYHDDPNCFKHMKGCFEHIFPELKESEDERIKKAIKYCIKQGFIGHGRIENVIVDDCLAWLESKNHINSWNSVKDLIAPSNKDILAWYRKEDGKLEGLPKIVWFWDEEESKNETNLAYWVELPEDEFDKTYWYEKQKPVERSEEDERILVSIIDDTVQENQLSKSQIDWLKSLKPQNRWKPTDEQMLAINTAINVLGKGTVNGKYLVALYEQLLKLMEE